MKWILEKLSVEWEVFLGEKSLYRLLSFLNGYSLSNFGNIVEINQGLQKWVSKKFDVSATYNIFYIIMMASNHNDSIAFDVFYNELELLRIDGTDINEYQIIKTNDYKKLDNLLLQLKKHRGLLGNERQLEYIYYFICGYNYGMHNKETTIKFQKWIEEKYNVTTGQEWYRIINFYSIPETNAMENFYILLDEFLIETTGKNLEENAMD